MILTGQLRFAVIVAATGRDAKNMLKAIKADLHTNKVLLQDYPEACVPIKEVARSPRRCALQTVKGEFTDINWQPEQIKLPTVEGSRCSGAKIYARSLDGSIRGLNEDDERPDFILIDDPETQESAKSLVQIESREHTINQDLSGLAVQGDPLGMLMLTTVQTRICLSLKYTDPQEYPSWDGKRWKSMESWPSRPELWDEYMMMRKEDQQNGDKWGKNATAFYEKQSSEMNAGALIANPYAIPKGCKSALQGLYNFIADKGLDAFLTEYQNDPPADDLSEGNGLTETRVINKMSGLPRTVVPRGCKRIVATIDLGKHNHHWQVTAWMPNDAGFVIEYDRHAVIGTEGEMDRVQIETAVLRSLRSFRDLILASEYVDEDGEVKQVNLCLVDSGDFTDAVYAFCLESNGMFLPSKGLGDTYRATPAQDKYIGNHYWYHAVPTNTGHYVPLYLMDSNYWKHQCHDAWAVPMLNDDESIRANSLSVFSEKNKSQHIRYAKHQLAEQYEEIFIPGKGLKRRWDKKSKDNHWFDTCYMSFAAREILKDREKMAQAALEYKAAATSAPKAREQNDHWTRGGWDV